MNFPKHDCGMCLQHNEHKNNYEKIEDYIEDNDRFDFKDDGSKKKCIETNEIWTLQWYPHTPVGFCCVAAPTLEELLEFANSEE